MNVSLRKLLLPIVSLSILSTASVATAKHKHSYKNKPVVQVEKPTIVDFVSKSGGVFDTNNRDFDILLNAVQAAGLTDALADRAATLTVLAPTDKAFIRLAQDLGYVGNDEAGAYEAIVAELTMLGNGDPTALLTSILAYHVLPESLRVRDIVRSESINTLLADATITPNGTRLIDNEPDLKNARFISPKNKRKANGVVHAINRVLLPVDLAGNTVSPALNIVDTVAASGGVFDRNRQDFDILLNAVAAANLGDALADAGADLTVFAPNDKAFIDLANKLGYRGRNEEQAFNAIVAKLTELSADGNPVTLLTDILLYHVSAGSKTVKQITDAEAVDTLLTDASFTSLNLFLVDNAPLLRSPKIVTKASNILATNGIIHTINRVLMPLDVAPVKKQKRNRRNK